MNFCGLKTLKKCVILQTLKGTGDTNEKVKPKAQTYYKNDYYT